MDTATHFVFLMHPKEYKQEKAATGRLTHLCLRSSRIVVGTDFDQHEEVQALLHDPARYPTLLYPGPEALNLSTQTVAPAPWGRRQLTVFILDATWACARKMLRLSPSLQRLPRLMFQARQQVSRYRIKQQPQEGCLSTLEATHELLLALSAAGLDAYPDPEQLLRLFERMQDYQIRCAADPEREGYRRHAYKTPVERKATSGHSAQRRQNYLPRLSPTPPPAPTAELPPENP